MASTKTIPTQFRLTSSERSALQELAMAGWVQNPTDPNGRHRVNVLRKMIRDAWQECPATKDKPFPTE